MVREQIEKLTNEILEIVHSDTGTEAQIVKLLEQAFFDAELAAKNEWR